MSGYTANDYATLTSATSKTRLDFNPYTRADNGTWNPLILFTYTRTSVSAEPIFLRFKTDSIIAGQEKTIDIQINAVFCESVEAQSSIPNQFRTIGDPLQTIDLTQYFKASALTDRPVCKAFQYKLSTSETEDPSLSTFKTFTLSGLTFSGNTFNN